MRDTINKRWVANRIKEGKVEVKCLFHLTDDYAFDNANNGGKMETFLPAFFGKYEDFTPNKVLFYDDEFSCYGEKEGTFRIRIHSNLVYDARIIKNY